MKKGSFYESTHLDVDFYKEFYQLQGDNAFIREHYSTIGIAKKLFPNKQCYVNTLSVLLEFDLDVFVSNASSQLESTVHDNHTHAYKESNVAHFMSLYYGNLIQTKPSGGQVFLPMNRMLNSVELIQFNNRWVQLMNDIENKTQFDAQFYLFFYKDLKLPEDPFQDWVTDGIFQGRHPNMKSYLSNENCFSKLAAIMPEVDFNFIVKTYLQFLKDKLPASLTEVELPMYIFFNLGKSKRLFWSENAFTASVEARLNKFSAVVSNLKAMKSYDDHKLNELMEQYKKKREDSVSTMATSKKHLLKLSLKRKADVMKILKKVMNSRYVESYVQLNKLKDSSAVETLHKLISTLLKNVVDASSMGEMELKEFALACFYNGLLGLKKDMSKEEFMTLVKSNALKLLSDKLSSIDAVVLEKDLDFLISSKMFVKATRLLTKIALQFIA